MIKRVSIWDLDGTIIDSSHRYRTRVDNNGDLKIDLEYWRENESRVWEDTLLPLYSKYREDLQNPEVFVIIATARVLNTPDIEYIEKVLGKPDYIIGRKSGDNQSGKYLKAKGIQKFFNLKPFKFAEWVFYEDNIEYLKYVCDKFDIQGVYCPSCQGF